MGSGGRPVSAVSRPVWKSYCVYACTHNVQEKSVSIQKLLYAGESENMRKRVSGHDAVEGLGTRTTRRKKLCFSAAMIASESDWQRAEAAMIHHDKSSLFIRNSMLAIIGQGGKVLGKSRRHQRKNCQQCRIEVIRTDSPVTLLDNLDRQVMVEWFFVGTPAA